MSNSMKHFSCIFIVVFLVLAAWPASNISSAQDIGLGLRAGTTGIGGELGFSITPKLIVRGHFTALSQTVKEEEVGDDPKMLGSGKAKTGAIMGFLDFHPFGNSFRLTVGAGKNQFDVSASVVPAENVCFGDKNQQGVCDGKEMTPERLGTLSANVTYPSSIHPYAGIGFGNLAYGRSTVTFLFDAGVTYAGSPEITLTNDGLFSPTTTTENVQTLNDGIESFKWYPVVSLGLGFRF